jgi:xylan 1,4-beta-xylosidase
MSLMRLGNTSLAMAILLAGAAVAAPTGVATLTVDAAKPIGLLKPLRGVNGAPDMSFVERREFGPMPPRAANVSAGYADANVNLIRTHDSLGAADIDSTVGPLSPLPGPALGGGAQESLVIFPDLGADASDPRSYNFGPTDRLIGAIYGMNAEAIFRLGRGAGTTAEPPQDLLKYGEIIRHIVLHYNKGWANGFHYGIRYWEVWNEPDLGPIWWRGTPEQFYRLYAVAAAAIKTADDGALVGGPTIAVVNEPSAYREGFLQYARDNHLPLDFYSWHYYSVDANDPQDFVRIGREMRRLLDQYGFTRATSMLDEWNYGIMERIPATPAHHAAFIASSLIYMQDAPIDQEALYRADHCFGADGRTPDKSGQALIALGRMSRTPMRLAATGADLNGLAVEAGRSSDQRTIQVIISNYRIPDAYIGPRKGADVMQIPGLGHLTLLPRRSGVTYDRNAGYALTIHGLEAGAHYAVERYRISEHRDFSLLDSAQGVGPSIELAGELEAPGIDLVTVRRTESARN